MHNAEHDIVVTDAAAMPLHYHHCGVGVCLDRVCGHPHKVDVELGHIRMEGGTPDISNLLPVGSSLDE